MTMATNKSPWWEGVVSMLAFIGLSLLARSTANPALLAIRDIVFFVCIIAAVSWMVLAIIGRFGR